MQEMRNNVNYERPIKYMIKRRSLLIARGWIGRLSFVIQYHF